MEVIEDALAGNYQPVIDYNQYKVGATYLLYVTCLNGFGKLQAPLPVGEELGEERTLGAGENVQCPVCLNVQEASEAEIKAGSWTCSVCKTKTKL